MTRKKVNANSKKGQISASHLDYNSASRKGNKGTRGVPVLHDEVKQSLHLSLTPTAKGKLTALATEAGISSSEFVERLMRVDLNCLPILRKMVALEKFNQLELTENGKPLLGKDSA